MKKILALVLACMMIASLFAGCQPASEAITLKVWAPQEDQVDDTSWLNVMLKKFEEAHPEYQITWDTGVCSEGEAGKNVPQDVSSAADVYLFANDQLGTLLQAGALAQLGGSYLEQVKNDVSATYLNTVTYTDGNVYGFPMACNTWFMYYNKEIFTEEDVKSLEAMLAKGKVAFPMTTGWYTGSFFMANGGTLFGDAGVDGKAGIQFGGEAGYAAAAKMVELMANGNFVNDADGLGNTGLKNGTVGAYFSGDWEYEGLKAALGDKLGAVSLPTVNIGGKDVSMKSFAGSKAVGVNPNCKNQKAAMELAAFLASSESQLVRFQLRNITPAVTALAENDAIKNSIIATAQNNTMANTSVAQPSIPEMGDYWSPIQVFGENIVNGKVTADNVKEQVDALMKALNNSGL